MNTTTATTTTRPADVNQIVAQIGRMNILAISGGRIVQHTTTDTDGTTFVDGIVLPVRYGYSVEITLAANDTYVVERVWTRSGKSTVKESRSNVYADELGDAAYTISCWN